MKKISKLLFSFICICAIMTASVSFAFAADKGNYYVEDGILYVTGEKNIDKLNSDRDNTDICICDSDISGDLDITNTNICTITFRNCNVKTGNITLPEYLTEITFDKSSFTDYSFLGNLTSLDSLSLSEMNNITDLKPFSSAETITTIKVHRSPNFRSVDGIENFKDLDFVSIADCGIESVEPMRSLKKLDTLAVTSCDVNSLEPVKNAPLTRLYLSNSVNIRNLDIVTGFPNLEILYAENLEMAYSEKLVDFIEQNNIESNITREALEYKNEIKSIAKRILKDNMTVQQKVEKIVHYVTEHMEYDCECSENTDLSVEYNLNGLKYALAGKGCCRNYTSFVTALMYEAGFESYEVENGEHIWNLIKINGKFYWLDTTWIDGLKPSEYNDSGYYMADDENFLESHENGAPYPASYTHASKGFLTTDFENSKTDTGKNAEKNKNDSNLIEKIRDAASAVFDKNENEEKPTTEIGGFINGKPVSHTNSTATYSDNGTDESVSNKTVIIICIAAASAVTATVVIIIIRKRKALERIYTESEIVNI